MQIERIAPYVTTLNPGYDPSLPLYKPLPMFDAMKAAIAEGGPQPCPWDHRPEAKPKPAAPAPTITSVAIVGAPDGVLAKRLVSLGVPLAGTNAPAAPGAGMLIIDAQHLDAPLLEQARLQIPQTLKAGGTVLVMLDTPGSLDQVNSFLPAPVQTSAREATGLVPKADHPWGASLRLADVTLADEGAENKLLRFGLTGPFVEKGRVILEASNVDWSLFNNPENAKAGATVLYEQLEKAPGAALVEMNDGGGKIVVSALNFQPETKAYSGFWRKLFSTMGVQLAAPQGQWDKDGKPKKAHDLLMDGPTG
jgi:beta-galactosidase